MMDGRALTAAAPVASKPSPVAKHVSSHVQDPMGATKEGFEDMQTKKLQYDQSREKMQRSLTPVQSVIDMASQLHGLTVGNNQTPMPGSPAMGQGMPGAQDNPEVDENGNPLPPNQTGQPGSMSGQPTGQPNGMQGKPAPGNGQNPQNMSQTVGKMNSNRPSLAGFQPGVSPGPQESVRPQKLGQAQPGKPIAQNSPQPKGSGNAQGNMYNKEAAPPKGNRTLPGAKGPGDAKVENRTKKAQSKSSREIKVHVTASAIPYDISAGASNKLDTTFGVASLSAQGTHGTVARPASGNTRQATPGTRPMGSPGQSTGNTMGRPNIQGGPASLSDKVSDPQHDVAYNPVNGMRSKGKKVVKIRTCGSCGKAHSSDMDCNGLMKARGHSLGAKKGWSVRGKHVSKAEKQAHYSTMN